MSNFNLPKTDIRLWSAMDSHARPNSQTKFELEVKKKTTGNDELNKLRQIENFKKKFSSPFYNNILSTKANPVNIQTEKKILSKIILPKISQDNNIHTPNKINQKFEYEENGGVNLTSNKKNINFSGNPALWLKQKQKSEINLLQTNNDNIESENNNIANNNNNINNNEEEYKPLLQNKFSNFAKPLNYSNKDKSEIDEVINTTNTKIIESLSNSEKNISKNNMINNTNKLLSSLEDDPYLHKSFSFPNFAFKILGILYEGQSCIIYKGINEDNGEYICIKKIYNKFLEIYNNEKKILSKISNENIIQYFGSETDYKGISKDLFLFFDFVGSNLKNIIDIYGPLNENLILIFLKQILKALNYLHNFKYIIHNDLRCSNILINSKSKIFLSDFGQSEFNNNEISLKSKKDIYNLGLTIIEMNGINPWKNYDKESTENNNIEIPNNFSEDLKDFIKNCLEKDIEKRFDVKMLLNHKFILNNN